MPVWEGCGCRLAVGLGVGLGWGWDVVGLTLGYVS